MSGKTQTDRRKFLKVAGGVGGLVVGGLVVGLTGGLFTGPKGTTQTQTVATQGTQNPAAPSEIKIGVAISLTGEYASTATGQFRGYQLLVDETNATGGLFIKEYGKKIPVRLVYYDDKSDTPTSVKLYEKLITEDKVHLLFGPYGSGQSFAVAAVNEKYKIPMIVVTAGAPNIFNRGFEYLFITTGLSTTFADPIFEFFETKKDEIKTVAITSTTEILATSLADAMKAKTESNPGLKLVYNKVYPRNPTDLTPILTEIKALNPDAFLASTYVVDAILMTRQMMEIGWSPKFLFQGLGPGDPQYDNVLGKTAPEGILSYGLWGKKLAYPGAMEFWNNYVKKFGEVPTLPASAIAYAATQVMFKAVENAGTLDPEKIRTTLLSEQFTTIRGPYKYEAQGPFKYMNKFNKTYLQQYRNGEMEVVWPRDVSSASLLFPKPPWPK